MKTYIFPGQGAQQRGMGGDLFDEFAELTSSADKILGYSIKELCLKDPRRELNKTQFTQPALYVVNALTYFKKLAETHSRPDFVAGHSLGEFNALLAAECFNFETGLKLVKKRGELMAQAPAGGMAAILNASKDTIAEILSSNGLNAIDLANFNTFSQIVISGPKDEIAKAESLFQQGEMLYYPLNTGGAFHSRFMLPIQEKFRTYLKRFKLAKLTLPVISNVSAEPYKDEDIVECLSRQITSGVKWAESINYLVEYAENAGDTMEFFEIGHGDVLSKLVTKIESEIVEAKAVKTSSAEAPGLDQGSTDGIEEGDSTMDGEVSPIEAQLDNMENVENVDSIENGHVNRAEQAKSRVDEWNRNYPIGTRVKSKLVDQEGLETRTEAVLLFGHRAAVYINGYNGYFDLTEIEPVQVTA